MVKFHASTVCVVKRSEDDICIGSDGQITRGETITKNGEKKIGKIYNNTVLFGCAGTVADNRSLLEKFEKKLEENLGDLEKAAVELSKMLRFEKGLNNLESLMIVANRNALLVISGGGEIIKPDYDFFAIGSGGNYAYAAANGLYNHTNMCAEEIVKESLKIASTICVYTNNNIVTEKLGKI